MFTEVFDSYNWDKVGELIYSRTSQDVVRAINSNKRSLEDFAALISPAGTAYLEQMAVECQRLTQRRFGKNVQLYMPMYLSNECQNICTYCGFSLTNKIPRRTLTDDEIHQEAKFVKDKGYDSILLVTGEANKTVGVEYLKNAVQILRHYFSSVAIEVQPLEEKEYSELKEVGVNTVLVYQETYHKEEYKKHHPKGKKSIFNYRLETPDRIGASGIHKIGIGVLIGLEDWRIDSFYTAMHLLYLRKKYWKTKYTLSFPRLRPHSGEMQPKVVMEDKELVQLISAYRLLDEFVEISISTRESQKFRNNIVPIGVTTMSAESKTNPGGYTVDPQTLEQFEISDERSTAEIIQMIKSRDYEVVMKDWEVYY